MHARAEVRELLARHRRRRAGNGKNTDDSTAGPVVLERDLASGFREERVILAKPDVEPGAEPPSSLADENGATLHHVAIESLHAEPLRLAVSPIS